VASNIGTYSNPKFRNLPMNLTPDRTRVIPSVARNLALIPSTMPHLDRQCEIPRYARNDTGEVLNSPLHSEANSPQPRGYAFRPILSASRIVASHSGKAIQL